MSLLHIKLDLYIVKFLLPICLLISYQFVMFEKDSLSLCFTKWRVWWWNESENCRLCRHVSMKKGTSWALNVHFAAVWRTWKIYWKEIDIEYEKGNFETTSYRWVTSLLKILSMLPRWVE